MKKKITLDKIISLSPYLELLIRWVYWRIISQISILNKIRIKTKKSKKNTFDFDDIIAFLKNNGIKSDDIILVHSSYKELKNSGKSPIQIIEELKGLVNKGTLVMPSIRKFSNDPNTKNYLKYDYKNEVTNFDIYKSPVITGALPSVMLNRPDACISLFPLNNLVAIGKHSEQMMIGNLDGELPTPCGQNSAWKYLLEKDAYIVGLGVELASCLTMIHTIEDCLDQNWPINDWYRERNFKIIKNNNFELKTIRERKPIWGSLHWAGRTLAKDLIKNNIVKSIIIKGVIIEIISSQELAKFLNSKNSFGYPYFCVKSKLKRINAFS
jgi:aminoglycoside 3-N-acetyltransferase